MRNVKTFNAHAVWTHKQKNRAKSPFVCLPKVFKTHEFNAAYSLD